MDLTLSWDLLLLTVGIIVFAYNFLLGQSSTLKVIIALYVSALAADGMSGVLKNFLFDPSPGLQAIIGENEMIFFTGLRLFLFLIGLVVLVIRGGFHVGVDKHEHWFLGIFVHFIFSFLATTLFLSTILIYISGSSFVEGILYASDINIYEQSMIVRSLIDQYQLWFSLPAIGLLFSSFWLPKK